MKTAIRKTLAAKTALLAVIVCLSIQPQKEANAGIPVIDVAGLVQAVLSAVENVAQTLQMVESYRTQLTQYENQLLNTINPDTWIWDRAQQTMNDLRRAVDTIQGYKNTLGSLENYLDKYKDLNYYKNHPCLTSAGCTDTQRQDLMNIREFASEATKKANDSLIKGLDIQQESMVSDARQLERIQNAAQTAGGQVEAIQYANQLAGNQINQLLQIRSLLVAQQSAATSMLQAENDVKAQETAATQKLRDPVFTPSTPTNW
jgi:P-type conjugative transfer protein TrbJ